MAEPADSDSGPWVAAAPVEHVPDDRGLCVVVNDTPVALFKADGEVHAIDDRCPHMGMSLASGRVSNGVVECPWHGWRFRVADGAWVSCPKNRTATFPTRVANGVVYLQMKPPTTP